MYEQDFCEYSVKKRAEGKYLLATVAAALLSVIFAVFFFLFLLPKLDFIVNAIIIAVFGYLVWYLSRFSAIEYEYTQTGAIFDAAAVYNKQYRKEKCSVDLKKQGKLVAPYKNGRIEGGHSPRKIFDLRSSASVKNAYVIVFENNGGTDAVLFDATARIINNIRHQVPSITVLSDGLPD